MLNSLRKLFPYSCGGVRPRPLVLRPQVGPLYQSRMTDERTDHWCKDNSEGKSKALGANPPQRHSVHHNDTRTAPRLNSDLRSENSTTNHVNSSTGRYASLTHIEISLRTTQRAPRTHVNIREGCVRTRPYWPGTFRTVLYALGRWCRMKNAASLTSDGL